MWAPIAPGPGDADRALPPTIVAITDRAYAIAIAIAIAATMLVVIIVIIIDATHYFRFGPRLARQ